MAEKREETQTEEVTEEVEEESEEPEEEDPLAKAREEAEQYKDQWLRAVADLDNYKKRSQRDFAALSHSAKESLIRDLLPTLDAVQRALEHQDGAKEESDSYREGVTMIMEQLPKLLENHGLSEIDAVGESFDPHSHEALMQVDSDEHDEGVVSNVVERGYRFGDRVMRAAKVVVSRGNSGGGAQEGQSNA